MLRCKMQFDLIIIFKTNSKFLEFELLPLNHSHIGLIIYIQAMGGKKNVMIPAITIASASVKLKEESLRRTKDDSQNLTL